ncbi:hypothetical protein [Vibrio penaeicida]|nr:hypothetical protein [Vibrio penaeicida]
MTVLKIRMFEENAEVLTPKVEIPRVCTSDGLENGLEEVAKLSFGS